MARHLNILLIGGSGFVSGTLARTALAQGHRVWCVTRGQRKLAEGIRPVIADRHEAGKFHDSIRATNQNWDLVVDCIGYDPVDAKQDLAVFRDLARHLVFVSTDFVYDPACRTFPQREDTDHYLKVGYGGKKRQCELELIHSRPGTMTWTILRPCHIYGPGSLLGCLPLHGRDPTLIAKLKAGETLQLVGGGHFLQQPIYATDLSEVILSTPGNRAAVGKVLNVAGPDIIESREYYRIIADILQAKLQIEETSVRDHLSAHPESAPFLCHRIYDRAGLQHSGLKCPSTPVRQGLREHVQSLLAGPD